MFKSIKGVAVVLLLTICFAAASAQAKPATKPQPEEQAEQSAEFGPPKQGDMAVGGNLAFGIGKASGEAAGYDLNNFGIGAKFQYNATDPLRLEGSFTYFLDKDIFSEGGASVSVSIWDLGVNAHWLLPAADKIAVYPLAGLSMQGTTVTVTLPYLGGTSFSATNFGINLGGGADYQLTDKLTLNAELKYKIATEWNRLLISAGAAYKF